MLGPRIAAKSTHLPVIRVCAIMLDDKTRRSAICPLPQQPRPSGKGEATQIAGWSFLQPQIHSAQEASGNESETRRCRYTAERHMIPTEFYR